MAKKKNKKRFVYRDSLTGKLVSKAKWKRSKSHGGTRYTRQSVKKQSRKRVKTIRLLPTPSPVKTWFVTFQYQNQRGTRTFDFFVRAKNERDAEKFIHRFAAKLESLTFNEDDPRSDDYKSVLRYLESFGWSEKRFAEIPRGSFAEYETKTEGFVSYQ